uniref:Putative glycosomal membrane protein n=1 Tax=Trypanosoma vivax (strain Y486) TaxID=1055687 RepID=G0U359_TRYVY|nr:putative glycosomal membrane protein [Trypanosoma vivax Y486]
MSLDFHNYLCNNWNHDKVMAIAQFLPMALENHVRSAGCDSLAQSLRNLSKMADAYRAVTRLTLLVNAVSRKTLGDLALSTGDCITWRLKQLSHACHVGFCLSENIAVLAGHGVLTKELTRFGGAAVVCWFYGLVLGIVGQVYLLVKHRPDCKALGAEKSEKKVLPYTHVECKQAIVSLLKLGCYAIFALSCLPEGKPQLSRDPNGMLMPLNALVRAVAPAKLYVSDSTRGLLGLIASVCEFY